MKIHPLALGVGAGLIAAPALAGDDCDVPVEPWQSRDAVMYSAAQRCCHWPTATSQSSSVQAPPVASTSPVASTIRFAFISVFLVLPKPSAPGTAVRRVDAADHRRARLNRG